MSNADETMAFAVEISDDLWRVSGRKFIPMVAPPRDVQGEGRFDDPAPDSSAGYSVLYCAETPEAAFIEVLDLHRLRLDHFHMLTDPLMMEAGEREAMNFDMGKVPQGWMATRQLTSSRIALNAPLFDLSKAGAVQLVRERLALTILALGEKDLDFSHVLSDNRELTRAISRWIWSMTTDAGEPLYSGIRYRSRFDPDCICIALYQDRFQVEGDILTRPITSETPGFAEATSTLRLTIA